MTIQKHWSSTLLTTRSSCPRSSSCLLAFSFSYALIYPVSSWSSPLLLCIISLAYRRFFLFLRTATVIYEAYPSAISGFPVHHGLFQSIIYTQKICSINWGTYCTLKQIFFLGGAMHVFCFIEKIKTFKKGTYID